MLSWPLSTAASMDARQTIKPGENWHDRIRSFVSFFTDFCFCGAVKWKRCMLWHQKYTSASQIAAARILPFLFEAFEPKSYLELGAGYGQWCRVAIDSGVVDSLAVDGPWTDLTALHVDRSKFLIKDLGKRFELGRRFDLALTLEVAAHICIEEADIFLDNLTRHSDLIVFGAAVPLQGGYRHLNEQWQLLAKFVSRKRLFVV